MAKVPLILYIDPALKARLVADAKQDGRTLSAYSGRLLEQAVGPRGAPARVAPGREGSSGVSGD